jgi:hypothetical protein
VQITTLSNIISVSGGDWHSAALGSDGVAWQWGRNDVGQLGFGSADGGTHPFPARILTDKNGAAFSNLVLLAARDWHNIAVKTDGSVWQWGANDQGQCGNNATNDCWRPVQVSGLGPRARLPLRIQPGAQPGNAVLSWTSATGEFFDVEYSTNVLAGFTRVLLTNVPSTPPINLITVPVTNGVRFYQLRF